MNARMAHTNTTGTEAVHADAKARPDEHGTPSAQLIVHVPTWSNGLPASHTGER
jgi:hypothetical protein